MKSSSTSINSEAADTIDGSACRFAVAEPQQFRYMIE